MFIREAGTHNRPDQEVFEFRPSPSSPIYNSFVRQSIDASSPRQSWRASMQSAKSYVSADKGTQTDIQPPTSHPPRSESAASSRSLRNAATDSPSENPWDTPDTSEDHEVHDEFENDNDFEILDASNAPVDKRESVRSAISSNPVEENSPSSNFSRPRLVTIPKRIPPTLPPRNPVRRNEATSTQEPVVPGPVSPSTSAHAEVSDSVPKGHEQEEKKEEEEEEEKQQQQEEEEQEAEALKETSPNDVIPDVAVSTVDQHEPHVESSVAEKDEFHSTPTSPAEEIKSLELEDHKDNDQTEKESKSEA